MKNNQKIDKDAERLQHLVDFFEILHEWDTAEKNNLENKYDEKVQKNIPDELD